MQVLFDKACGPVILRWWTGYLQLIRAGPPSCSVRTRNTGPCNVFTGGRVRGQGAGANGSSGRFHGAVASPRFPGPTAKCTYEKSGVYLNDFRIVQVGSSSRGHTIAMTYLELPHATVAGGIALLKLTCGTRTRFSMIMQLADPRR